MKRLAICFCLCVAGCSATSPVIHYASENTLELRYKAYDSQPTLTAEAIDLAVRHCEKYGKGVKHVSSRAVNLFTTKESHTFMCTNDFTDERIEVDIEVDVE